MSDTTEARARAMVTDLTHTGEMSMLYRCAIADTITALLAENERLRSARPATTVAEAAEEMHSFVVVFPSGAVRGSYKTEAQARAAIEKHGLHIVEVTALRALVGEPQ